MAGEWATAFESILMVHYLKQDVINFREISLNDEMMIVGICHLNVNHIIVMIELNGNGAAIMRYYYQLKTGSVI